MKRCLTVNALLQRFFYQYAFVIFRYRWLFLIAPPVLAILSSCGFYFIQDRTRNETYYIYTPIGAVSYYERAVLSQHWPLIPEKFLPGKFYSLKHYAEVMVRAKDGGNMLRREHMDAVIDLNRVILNNFSVPSFDHRFNITYKDVCLNWEGECYENGQLELLKNSRDIDKYVPITYPISRKTDSPVYLGTSVGGVRLADTRGRFDSAQTLRLIYSMVEDVQPFDAYSIQWMYGLESFVNGYQSPYLDLAINHADTLNQGLAESATRLTPKFAITFMVLTIFSVLCSFVTLDKDETDSKSGNFAKCFNQYSVDWVRSKPGLAAVGVLSACMSIAAALGFMLFIGREFNAIISVMPFLVLSIGVNDMCIMTHAWHRTSMHKPVDERLAETLSEAAVAISITSFTDVISFAIGTWNSLPAVIMFCSYTSLALLVEYIMQITFFTAAFAFYGIAEAQGRHCMCLWKRAIPADSQDLNNLQKILLRGTVVQSPEPSKITESLPEHSVAIAAERETKIMRFFRLYYAPKILHPVGRVCAIILYAVYASFAVWGLLHIEEGLKFKNLVHREHYMMKYINALPDFWHEGMQAQITVNNPPNLTLAHERLRLTQMASRFENASHTMSSNATMFFLYEYMNYLDDLNAKLMDTEDMWYTKLKRWIKHTGSRAEWETDLHWSENETNKLLAFRFQVGLRDFSTPAEHRAAATEIRNIASEYPDYNVTTYHEYWPFVDQYIIIRPTVIQDNIIAVVSMIAIAVILIPNLACAVFITLSMLSINLGVYGYMTWWGVDLDCVSMITYIMALGFAVDYSAHICYGYVTAAGTTSERTVTALHTLGWPVFQGASATIIGTFVLASVDAYLVQTFFKTVFLTITFGLLHSIVFLPTAISLLLPENMPKIYKFRPIFGASKIAPSQNGGHVEDIHK